MIIAHYDGLLIRATLVEETTKAWKLKPYNEEQISVVQKNDPNRSVFSTIEDAMEWLHRAHGWLEYAAE